MEKFVKNKNITPGMDEVTIISTGVKLKGSLTSDGNVRVDGNVEGNVSANGNITVGDHGEIKGNVNADNVVVGGKVIGIVFANEKLVLEANATLQGDISTKILVIAPGAKFDGNSKMMSSQGASSTSSEKDTQHQHDKNN
jgi:cytoskeletal protein CcmA (bactofilin family)